MCLCWLALHVQRSDTFALLYFCLIISANAQAIEQSCQGEDCVQVATNIGTINVVGGTLQIAVNNGIVSVFGDPEDELKINGLIVEMSTNPWTESKIRPLMVSA